MAQGNRGFAQGLSSGGSIPTSTARLPPRTGILSARDNRLAELAAGSAITRIHELVDPAKCRVWDGHNRDYAALTEGNCTDLIESFKGQGRQEVPAIVRRVVGDPRYAFEVICGARRHWTASWMRTHGFPDFKFLVEPRELTDEEAFRVADLENRSRRDLSDYERATDYARAIERYYDGSQQRMADRLEVSKSWLSRYLELARLPKEILASFGTPHVIGISHCATLAPLLRVPVQRSHVLEEARRIADEQTALLQKGSQPMPPAAVVSRLVKCAREAGHSRKIKISEHVVRSADGAILARGQKAERGTALIIKVPAPGKHTRENLLRAVAEIIEEITPKASR